MCPVLELKRFDDERLLNNLPLFAHEAGDGTDATVFEYRI